MPWSQGWVSLTPEPVHSTPEGQGWQGDSRALSQPTVGRHRHFQAVCTDHVWAHLSHSHLSPVFLAFFHHPNFQKNFVEIALGNNDCVFQTLILSIC